jgi:Rrf2 family protein
MPTYKLGPGTQSGVSPPTFRHPLICEACLEALGNVPSVTGQGRFRQASGFHVDGDESSGRASRGPLPTRGGGATMKLSRASYYAVAALVYLARHDDQAVASHDIARAEALPERFLLKVLHPLVRAGVLNSLKGPSGGYRLARPAKVITLLNVIEAVDGPITAVIEVMDDTSVLARRLQRALELAAADNRRCLARVTVANLAKRG